MATNDLYKMIQEKQAALDAQNVDLAKYQTDAAGYNEGLKANVYGNDAVLPQLRKQYSQGVLDLFKYDQEKSKSYLSPEQQAQGMVADPMVGEAAKMNKFNGTAKQNEYTWQKLDERKTILGDVIKSAMDKYNAEISGKKTLIDSSNDSLDTAIKLLTEQRLQEVDDNGKTAKERLRNANLDQLNADIANGATIQDVMDRYAKDLDQSDIMDEYNKNNKYGKVGENNTTLNTMYRAAKAGSSTLDLIGQISNKQVANDVASNALMAGDSKAFLQQLGTENPDYLQAMVKGDFPLAKKLAAKFGKDSSFYSQLNAYAANVIKAYYGSAFTSTEVTAARQWIANPTVQNGNQLYSSLVANNLTASRRIKTGLASVGITDENYVNKYLAQIGGNYDPKTGLTTGTSSSNNNSNNSQLPDDEIKKILGQ